MGRREASESAMTGEFPSSWGREGMNHTYYMYLGLPERRSRRVAQSPSETSKLIICTVSFLSDNGYNVTVGFNVVSKSSRQQYGRVLLNSARGLLQWPCVSVCVSVRPSVYLLPGDHAEYQNISKSIWPIDFNFHEGEGGGGLPQGWSDSIMRKITSG